MKTKILLVINIFGGLFLLFLVSFIDVQIKGYVNMTGKGLMLKYVWPVLWGIITVFFIHCMLILNRRFQGREQIVSLLIGMVTIMIPFLGWFGVHIKPVEYLFRYIVWSAISLSLPICGMCETVYLYLLAIKVKDGING